MNKSELLFALRLKQPIENLCCNNKIRDWIIDENVIDNENKNYIYFIIIEGKVAYVGQANQGFCRRIKQHMRHLIFYNYITLELMDDENVFEIEKYWINKCNPILNGILTPWEKFHCKSEFGYNGTLDDVIEYAKINSPYYAIN